MLFFTRWKAAAILLTALVVCLFAVPNFFSENTVRAWPSWAQRHLVLGLDLQGGSRLLLEVDTNAVRKERLQGLADDVLRVLRQARIPFTGRAIHGNSVEVRITRESDVENAVAKLRELSQPLSGILGSVGQRSLDVTESGGLITLTPIGRRASPSASARPSINRSRSSSGASTSSAWSSRPSSARARRAFWCRCRACRIRRG